MKRFAFTALLMPLISIAATPLFAAENTHFAVPAMMGNAKIGLLCAQAPEFASRDCQTAVIPDNVRTRALFPSVPEQYNLYYRNAQSPLFSQYEGYPFVVKRENNLCTLENSAVITRKNESEFPAYSYSCDGEALESANTSRIMLNYLGQGDFQTENDTHFYAGITMDVLYEQFMQMYPESPSNCQQDSHYCLRQLSVIVDGSSSMFSSSWDGENILLASGLASGGYFSHGSSLDIIAHETGHAVLTWNSDIAYESNDTAAIQESIADLTALLVRSEFYSKLQTSGEQNFIESEAYLQLSADGNFYYALAWDSFITQKAQRYLFSPMTDGISIDDWRDRETQVPGQHFKAGILNRFFYRLATSNGWDIAKTFRLTMKAAQTCFVEDTTFEHAAFCLIDAAEEQDKALGEKLMAELSGILNWAIEGCLKWQQEGLTPPEIVERQTAEYKCSMDSISQFISDECVVGSEHSMSSSRFYERYRDWCSRSGRKPQPQSAFKRQLEKIESVYQKRTSSGMHWYGISPCLTV